MSRYLDSPTISLPAFFFRVYGTLNNPSNILTMLAVLETYSVNFSRI